MDVSYRSLEVPAACRGLPVTLHSLYAAAQARRRGCALVLLLHKTFHAWLHVIFVRHVAPLSDCINILHAIHSASRLGLLVSVACIMSSVGCSMSCVALLRFVCRLLHVCCTVGGMVAYASLSALFHGRSASSMRASCSPHGRGTHREPMGEPPTISVDGRSCMPEPVAIEAPSLYEPGMLRPR